MSNTEYPKVLLLGHQFNNQTGLGITLANLFANWPRENVSILSHSIDVAKCELSRPCINYIGRVYEPSNMPIRKGFKNVIREKIKNVYYYLGFNELRHVSPYIESYITKAKEFEPDILFCCLGSLNSMKDCFQILPSFPDAKLVLYIVDDWVNTKENNRLFSRYWRKINDRYFRALIDKAAGLLSICPYMTAVYKELYCKDFIPFHNPVDCNYWNSLTTVRKYEPGVKALLYVGKINVDTKQCLLDVASAIDVLNRRKGQKFRYVLDVYTPDYKSNQDLFSTNNNCNVLPAVPHGDIPSLSKSYDALLLTLGFSKKTRDYVRLSMPTKVSEYMASGIPTILYCPNDIALAKYLEPQSCTINCLERDFNMLTNSLLRLEDESYCQIIINNAARVANNHDCMVVRHNFENSLRSFL